MACTEKNFWFTRDVKNVDLRFPAGPHKGFTGKDKHGNLYHRGQRWYGPSNLMGRPDLVNAAANARAPLGQ